MGPFSAFSHTTDLLADGVPFAGRSNPPSYLPKGVGESLLLIHDPLCFSYHLQFAEPGTLWSTRTMITHWPPPTTLWIWQSQQEVCSTFHIYFHLNLQVIPKLSSSYRISIVCHHLIGIPSPSSMHATVQSRWDKLSKSINEILRPTLTLAPIFLSPAEARDQSPTAYLLRYNAHWTVYYHVCMYLSAFGLRGCRNDH